MYRRTSSGFRKNIRVLLLFSVLGAFHFAPSHLPRTFSIVDSPLQSHPSASSFFQKRHRKWKLRKETERERDWEGKRAIHLSLGGGRVSDTNLALSLLLVGTTIAASRVKTLHMMNSKRFVHPHLYSPLLSRFTISTHDDFGYLKFHVPLLPLLFQLMVLRSDNICKAFPVPLKWLCSDMMVDTDITITIQG
jgi:hypothetical protein